MHQSFVSTPPPHLRVLRWNGWAMVQCKYFLIAPTVPEKCGGYNIETLTALNFSVVYGGAKSWVVTISLSPQGGAYTRVLKSEKSLSPPSRRMGSSGYK